MKRMIQFNVLSEIIFKSEQVLKISDDVLEMLYFCELGKKSFLMNNKTYMYLGSELYFERVEIFL